MEQITLDLIPKGSLPVLHASQYDDGRQWQVNLKENGEDYTLTDETIVLGVRKGDGCAVTCAVAVESGRKYVILTSTEQMCAVAGQNLAELQITKNNTKIGTLNFILQVERDPLDAGISSGSEIHDLQHQVDSCVHTAFETIGASGLPYDNTESGLTADNVQQAIDEVNEKASSLPSYVYTKEETDALLADKADNATLEADYYDKAETDALLADKADASALGDYYTKSETNTKLSGKADKGSVYTTAQVNTLLGDKADKSDLENYYTKSQTNSLLNVKADKANVYDKTYINGVLGQIDNAFTDVNTALGQKANSSDVYNKTYIDTALSAKANANAVYTKSEVDAKVGGLIDDETTASNKTWSSNKISEELEALLPVNSATGAIANFETSLELPLVSVKSAIVATQEAGTPTPQSPKAISGVSELSIKHSGSDVTDYDEYIVNLGGTYYGGYVEQDKDGKRQLFDNYSDLVNLSDLTFYPTTKGGHTCFYADLSNGIIKSGGEQAFSGKCSTYTVTSNLTLPNDLSCLFYCSELYGGYTRVLIRDDSASAMTGAQFTAYVTGQITYEKANPQTVALPDGEPIVAFNGVNNVWSDTNGDTTVEYKQGIQEYIDAKLGNNRGVNLLGLSAPANDLQSDEPDERSER